MNITSLVSQRAAWSPDAPALIDSAAGRSLTFSDFDDEMAAMASALTRSGIMAGSRILLLLPVSAELFIILAAILRAGCSAIFVDPSAGLKHLGDACTTTEPHAFIGVARAHLLCLSCPPLRRIPRRFVTDFPLPHADFLAPDKSRLETTQVSPEAPAVIRFTSGTTGIPKAAVRTHGFLERQFSVLTASLELRAFERDMVTMPMFVMANLAAGLASILPRADTRRTGACGDFSAEIHGHQPTRIIAAPALLERMADACLARRIRMDCLRKIFTGGAPVFPRLFDKLSTVAPLASVTGVYGSTEAEPIALLPGSALTNAVRARITAGAGIPIGHPESNTAVRIFNPRGHSETTFLSQEEFAAACVSQGEFGEIVVSGPHVLPAYLDPATTASHKLRVGDTVWHRTGDIGYLSPDGSLWLLGRATSAGTAHRGSFHPLAIAAIAMTNPRVHQASALIHPGRRLLCVAPEGPSSFPDGLVDEIVVFPSLPVDHRHQSRIDHAALAKLIENGCHP
ncbi:MAG: AMP-binding protein [Verrucomicrobiota bacterium]